MRIVQVLTYISVDGAYGGPVAVARAQCEELARMGHTVHLVAGWDGVAEVSWQGVDVHLHPIARLPVGGFAGFWSRALWSCVRRLTRAADVVHFHAARDLVQLPAAFLSRSGPAVVIQPHGMIRPDARLAARALDTLFVRPLYRRADAVLALTEQEVVEAPEVARCHVSVHRVRNGVKVSAEPVCWESRPFRVLYLARLHRRKRPLAFVEMATLLLREGLDMEFDMFGPDEGEGIEVRRAIAESGFASRITYHGAVEPSVVPSIMATAQAYVLPSVDEPFPMSLLEAMAAGLPAVLTDRTGISAELRTRQTAWVTSPDAAALAAPLRELYGSEATWTDCSTRARRDISENFSAAAVAQSLTGIYEQATARSRL